MNPIERSAPGSIRTRDRVQASIMAIAIVVVALKCSSHLTLLVLGAILGATMLTTALTAHSRPLADASRLVRATHLLTFGIIDALAALDEMTRLSRFY